jgi:hypothetical protein
LAGVEIQILLGANRAPRRMTTQRFLRLVVAIGNAAGFFSQGLPGINFREARFF